MILSYSVRKLQDGNLPKLMGEMKDHCLRCLALAFELVLSLLDSIPSASISLSVFPIPHVIHLCNCFLSLSPCPTICQVFPLPSHLLHPLFFHHLSSLPTTLFIVMGVQQHQDTIKGFLPMMSVHAKMSFWLISVLPLKKKLGPPPTIQEFPAGLQKYTH